MEKKYLQLKINVLKCKKLQRKFKHQRHSASSPEQAERFDEGSSILGCFCDLGERKVSSAQANGLWPSGVLAGKALSFINKQYFSDANGNRGGAPNVAVVLVDGWPTDKVEEASRLARESGINIFFVTIEGPDDSEKHNLVEANFVDKVE